MALHLNLLHEEIAAQRQRQRDPLKLGTMALAAIGALMVLFYVFKAYQTLEIKNRLGHVQSDWAKVEPKVTAAQKRSAELTSTIGTTKVLDAMVEKRFYWGPFLQTLSRCVAPNAQLTNLEGAVDDKLVTISLEGIAAGREPRAAAEELRQLLAEQLSGRYANTKVEFKTLEDLDTLITVAGANMPVARYTITVTFDSPSADTKADSPATARKKR
jgi:septal ring factor EnvC (AmiA/AmiB activator)